MNIIGHKKIINLLDKSIEKNNITHAYLFSGPESVGKFTLAKLFARFIISNKTDATLLDGNAVFVENEKWHPDLIVVKPEIEEKKGIKKEKKIEIEKIREAQKELVLFPYQGKYKILIINNAHRMTENSQNALLKILEEPNSTTIIILITHEEGGILPTVKSRCQKISFNLVSGEEIKNNLLILSTGTGAEEIAKLSLGRPGLAWKMANDKKELEFRRAAADKLKLLVNAGINQRLKIAEEMAKNAPAAIASLELWVWMLHLSVSENVKLFRIIEKIEKGLSDIKNTNANTRLILENLFLDL